MATRETGQHYQDPKKALWCLKKLPLLADIPHDTLQQLADSVQLWDLRRRQVIYLPGDPGQAVYFLSVGRVKISKVTRDGKELTLDYRVAGDPFGELCLIEGGAREDMAEAMDTSGHRSRTRDLRTVGPKRRSDWLPLGQSACAKAPGA